MNDHLTLSLVKVTNLYNKTVQYFGVNDKHYEGTWKLIKIHFTR